MNAPLNSSIGDEKDPLNEPEPMPLQISATCDPVKHHLPAATTLQEHLLHDGGVTARHMNDLRLMLHHTTVTVGGLEVGLDFLENASGIQLSVAILRQVEAGYPDDYDQLMFLTDKAAKVIAAQNTGRLLFRNLVTLSNRQAAILATFDGGTLEFNQLRNLTDAQAASLATFEGAEIDLQKVDTMTDAQVAYLSKFKGNRLFLGLCSITDDQARWLGRFAGEYRLDLRRLRIVTDDQAQSLASYKGDWLDLSGLEHITEEQAKIFGAFEGKVLSLWSAEPLTDAQVKALTALPRSMLGLGVRTLTDAQAQCIASHVGDVNIDKVERLSGSQALSLMQFGYSLYLGGIKEIDDSLATIFREFKGQKLHLGIETISRTVAQILYPIRNKLGVRPAIEKQIETACDFMR